MRLTEASEGSRKSMRQDPGRSNQAPVGTNASRFQAVNRRDHMSRGLLTLRRTTVCCISDWKQRGEVACSTSNRRAAEPRGCVTCSHLSALPGGCVRPWLARHPHTFSQLIVQYIHYCKLPADQITIFARCNQAIIYEIFILYELSATFLTYLFLEGTDGVHQVTRISTTCSLYYRQNRA
jgi:hypothetical protein